MNVFDKLTERGFIKDATHPELLRKHLEKPVTFYLGIEPTADNMHIGHFFALQVFKILQDHGHKGILLIGNATAMVGDPSFKNDMRKLLTQEEVNRNAHAIQGILHRFIDTERAQIVYNADWLGTTMGYVEFMRNVGQHFNVADMLNAECYKTRIGKGLTFLEMGYMLMQAYDFIYLNDKFGCTLEIGGSDQWGNIVAGVELGRKMSLQNGKPRPQIFAMCNPLLLNANGTKMGKTEKGTLWVSGDADAVYQCYQHFYNVADESVEQLLLFFTDLPVAEIKKMCKTDIVNAKKVMATAVTAKIHGSDAAARVAGGGADTAPEETVTVPRGATIIDILAQTSIIQSKREARELVAAGAILIDGEILNDLNLVPTKTEFVVKKGKKTYLRVKISSN